MFVKAAVICLVPWLLTVGIGSIDVFQDWFVALSDLSSLAGVLLWASLTSNFVDADIKKQGKQTANDT